MSDSKPSAIETAESIATALLPQVIATVAAAPDATIAPQHETRIGQLESFMARWGPLLEAAAPMIENAIAQPAQTQKQGA